MPVVAGMGGNAATQTLAVIVRGIALGELTWINARQALVKEGLVGLGNGMASGLVGRARRLGRHAGTGPRADSDGGDDRQHVRGRHGRHADSARPARLKVDPALASSIFITTFTDVFGFLSFLGLATVFIGFLRRRLDVLEPSQSRDMLGKIRATGGSPSRRVWFKRCPSIYG